jgi:hypothetical protein
VRDVEIHNQPVQPGTSSPVRKEQVTKLPASIQINVSFPCLNETPVKNMEILRNSRKAIGLLKFYRSKCKLLQNDLKKPSKNTYREYKKLPFETVDTNIARDVLIYKFDKTLKFLSVFISPKWIVFPPRIFRWIF